MKIKSSFEKYIREHMNKISTNNRHKRETCTPAHAVHMQATCCHKLAKQICRSNHGWCENHPASVTVDIVSQYGAGFWTGNPLTLKIAPNRLSREAGWSARHFPAWMYREGLLNWLQLDWRLELTESARGCDWWHVNWIVCRSQSDAFSFFHS